MTFDDAHWLDPSSSAALVYVARRLANDAVALLVASRDALPIPECVVGPLDAAAAAEALGDVAPAVAERLCAATGGNPLALAQAARTLTARQRAGTEPLPDPLPVGDDLFDRQIAALPDAARRALTIAAADDRVPVVTLAAALATCGLTLADLEPAETSELLNVRDDGVAFHHPLVRAAAYHRATPPERRAAHLALATALPRPRTARAAPGTWWPPPPGRTTRRRTSWKRSRRTPGAAARPHRRRPCPRIGGAPDHRPQAASRAAAARRRGPPARAAPSRPWAPCWTRRSPTPPRTRSRARGSSTCVIAAQPWKVPRWRARRGCARRPRECDPHDPAQARAMLVDAAVLHVMGGEPVEALLCCGPASPIRRPRPCRSPCARCWPATTLAASRLLDELAPMTHVRTGESRSGMLAPAVAQGMLFLGEGPRAHAAMERLVAGSHREGLIGQLPYALTVLAQTEFAARAWASARAHVAPGGRDEREAAGGQPRAVADDRDAHRGGARAHRGGSSARKAGPRPRRPVRNRERSDRSPGTLWGCWTWGCGDSRPRSTSSGPRARSPSERGVHHPLAFTVGAGADRGVRPFRATGGGRGADGRARVPGGTNRRSAHSERAAPVPRPRSRRTWISSSGRSRCTTASRSRSSGRAPSSASVSGCVARGTAPTPART